MTIPFLVKILELVKTHPDFSGYHTYIDYVILLLNNLNNACKKESSKSIVLDSLVTYELLSSSWSELYDVSLKSKMIKSIVDSLHTILNDLSGGALDDFYTACEVLGTLIKHVPGLSWLGTVFSAVKKIVQIVEKVGELVIAEKIIPLFHSYNGKVGVIGNDIFVDLESQMSDYNYFRNYSIVFSENSLLDGNGVTIAGLPIPIGHNLETRNQTIMQYIANYGNYATFSNIVTDDWYLNGEAFPRNHAELVIEPNKRNFCLCSTGEIKNPHILIQNRSETLDLTINNVSVTGGNLGNYLTSPFIEYAGTTNFRLNIRYYGTNTFKYLDGYKRKELGNIPAFKLDCVYVYFIQGNSEASLLIKGADGADGIDGRDGITGQSGKDGLDGSQGYTGSNGTDGTMGSHAISSAMIDFTDARKLTLIGGNGGSGGKGGIGGHGGCGGKGSDKNAGAGGRGGTGGNGGHGAFCGLPFYVTNGVRNLTISTTNNFSHGTIGVGGKGGDGGAGGDGGNASGYSGALWWKTYYNAGAGGRGGLVGKGGSAGFNDYLFDFAKKYFKMPEASGGQCGSTYGKGGAGGVNGDSKKASDGSSYDYTEDTRGHIVHLCGKTGFDLNGPSRDESNKIFYINFLPQNGNKKK
jgi:hypothetical protein